MKKINVTKPYLPNLFLFSFYLSKLWTSRILTNNGLFSKNLENLISKKLSNYNLVLFSNGHLVLEYILDAIKTKGEIITTPFTFISTTQSIVRTGNIPVFCDVKEDFTIDESKIEKLITKNTIAIMPVHVYGNVCNVMKIKEIADKHNLIVIYDAAHAFNIKLNGKDVSNFGDFVMYSFQATKVFHTIEGGALSTNNKLFPRSLFERKRNFGQESSEIISELGGNAKIDEVRSIIGILNLKKFPKEVKRRKLIYLKYFKHLSNIKGIKLNAIQKDVKTNHSYFPILFDGYKLSRDQVYELLQKYNIFARKYFYPLTSKAKAFEGLFPIQETPRALEYSEKVLTLPFYGELSLRDVDRICKIILRGY